MDKPIVVERKTVQELLISQSGQVYDFGARLATWLVVGNGAALAFGLKALVDGTHCNLSLITTSLQWFSGGLIAAFGGGVLSYLAATFSLHVLAREAGAIRLLYNSEFHLSDLERRGITVPEDNLLKVNEAKGEAQSAKNARLLQISWVFVPVVMLFYLVSMICFIAGLVAPISAGPSQLASCGSAIVGSPAVKPLGPAAGPPARLAEPVTALPATGR